MDDPDTWRVDDKREFCRIMKGDKYLPLSFLSFDEFNANKEIYGPDKVWFIKSRGGTGGKSVSCEYSKNITKTPKDVTMTLACQAINAQCCLNKCF